ncbi:TlpA family protein disulfide reductase [Flavobacterium sp. FlaQc-57]|uniref:TlpA family protein disulfide reductase n=1 Tax=Flavobacterium sp. FlaQc-57 TaxID=3374186 RepID=UPI0037584679
MKSIMLYFHLCFFVCALTSAQTHYSITGHFPQSVGKDVFVKGYDLDGLKILSKSNIGSDGMVKIVYPSSYSGAAILEVVDGSSVIIMLNKENFEIQWDRYEDFSRLKFLNSPENDFLSKGLDLYSSVESKKSGLNYLMTLYSSGSSVDLFLKEEFKSQEKLLDVFFETLPSNLYVSYYLKLRKLISDMPLAATRYTNRIVKNQLEFNSLDFGDLRLVSSGLSRDLFEGYAVFMESYAGADMDKLKVNLNLCIDSVLKTLKDKPEIAQVMCQQFFNILEKRSLFFSAEYLALSVLDNQSCMLDVKHQSLFEQYRKMAIGRIASDIVFSEPVNGYYKLSDLKSRYKLVVFGASWCDKCKLEVPKLQPFYEKWKRDDDLEIVFVSLDTDKDSFHLFSKDFLWISTCDYKSWEGESVLDYCVFATPTMYLLDRNQNIIAKPVSAEHAEAVISSLRGSK